MFGLSVVHSGIKRLFSLLIALLVYASGYSGTGGFALNGFLVRGCTPHLLSIPSYSFYDPTAKIDRNGSIDKLGSYTMYLAKNESEYCQIAFRLRLQRGKCEIRLNNFKNDKGDELETVLCREYYVKTNGDTIGGIYPDALIPLEGNVDGPSDFLAQTNYVYFIGVKTCEDTPSGRYVADIEFVNTDIPDNKYENLSVSVTANVWDFTLPEKPSCETAMGLDRNCIAKAHRTENDPGATQELYEAYYEFLLDHKISSYNLPVDILSDEADKYMSDPRCTSFVVPYGSDDYIRSVYSKLKNDSDWSKKAMFYPIDEPSTEEAYESYNAIVSRLERLYPDFNLVTPYYKSKVEINGESVSSTSLQKGKSNIICPVSNLFSEKSFVEEAHSRQNDGDRLWWYVCCGPAPSSGYCNLFVQYPGIRHRVLFWQQKKLDITGLLYWCVDYWVDVSDPWESAWTTPWTGPDTFGDGSLIYHGYHLGLKGPVSSLRLEAVTNGIEDYEYLTIAQSLLGDKYTDKIISRITNNLTDYTYSDRLFRNVRIELGNAIEKACS